MLASLFFLPLFQECFVQTLPVLQIIMPSVNLLPIWCWYLMFYKNTVYIVEDEKEEEDIKKGCIARFKVWIVKYEKAASRVAFASFLLVFVIGLSCVAFFLVFYDKPQQITFAQAMGGLSGVTNILQWAPQLIETLRTGEVGSLSIIMLALQVPGGFLVVIFNTVISYQSFTTWGPFAISATQQLILLIICLVYSIRDWRKGKKKNDLQIQEIEPLIETDEKVK